MGIIFGAWVNLLDDVPENGDKTSLVRTTPYYDSMINRAATILGMSKSAYMRLILVKISEDIIRQKDEQDGGNERSKESA